MFFRSCLLGCLSTIIVLSSQSTAHPPSTLSSLHRARSLPQGAHSAGNASFTVHSTQVDLANGNRWAPQAAKLSDGTILFASSIYPPDEPANGGGDVANTNMAANTNTAWIAALQVSRSTDDGKTFKPLGVIAKGPRDLNAGCLLELPTTTTAAGNATTGKRASPTILAAYEDNEITANGTYVMFRLVVARSEDGGKTWTDPKTVVQRSATPLPLQVYGPFLRIAEDGKTIQMTYSDMLSATNQQISRVTSLDFSETWTQPTNLRLHPDNARMRDGSNSIVSVGERLVMAVDVQTDTSMRLDYVISGDDGRSWGGRGTVFDPGSNNTAISGQMVRIGSYLAVVFLTNKDIGPIDPNAVPAPSGDPAGVGYANRVVFSDGIVRDGRLRWTETPLELWPVDSEWTGAVQLSDKSIMALSCRDFAAYGKIVSMT